MKKLLLVLTVCMCAWSASAQNWAVGGRIGSGFMADVQYVFSNDNYIEGRFGAYWANAGGTVTADFTALYNWNICRMNWTPSAGTWFFDAGAGINVAARAITLMSVPQAAPSWALISAALPCVCRSTGRRRSVPGSLIGTEIRRRSSTNMRSATSVSPVPTGSDCVRAGLRTGPVPHCRERGGVVRS